MVFLAGTQTLEAQVALLDSDPSGQSQVAAIRRLGERAREKYGQSPRGQRPLRVDPLPAPVRQNLANLGIFVMTETFSLMTSPQPGHLRALININRELATGLQGRG